MVIFLRYGLKGAVYLRSKDHQVVYVTSEGIPEWTAGSLVTTDQTVTVDSVLGSQTYRLFDHVTVSSTETVAQEKLFAKYSCIDPGTSSAHVKD